MEWNQAKDVLLLAVLGAVGSYWSLELRRLRQSADKLNVRLAVVIERLANHDKRIAKLESARR